MKPERGFSFKDGPLDMRMGRTGITAAELVNTATEHTLIAILQVYGEERHARRIARAIIGRRGERPFERTGDLVALIEQVVRRRPTDKIHSGHANVSGLAHCRQ